MDTTAHALDLLDGNPYVVLATADGTQSVDLRPTNTLGRHPNNSIQLLDKIVSKEHCIILVQDGQVQQGIDVHRRAGADPLIKLDGLGVVSLTVIQHRQPETGLLVVRVFAQGSLVILHGLIM